MDHAKAELRSRNNFKTAQIALVDSESVVMIDVSVDHSLRSYTSRWSGQSVYCQIRRLAFGSSSILSKELSLLHLRLKASDPSSTRRYSQNSRYRDGVSLSCEAEEAFSRREQFLKLVARTSRVEQLSSRDETSVGVSCRSRQR